MHKYSFWCTYPGYYYGVLRRRLMDTKDCAVITPYDMRMGMTLGVRHCELGVWLSAIMERSMYSIEVMGCILLNQCVRTAHNPKTRMPERGVRGNVLSFPRGRLVFVRHRTGLCDNNRHSYCSFFNRNEVTGPSIIIQHKSQILFHIAIAFICVRNLAIFVWGFVCSVCCRRQLQPATREDYHKTQIFKQKYIQFWSMESMPRSNTTFPHRHKLYISFNIPPHTNHTWCSFEPGTKVWNRDASHARSGSERWGFRNFRKTKVVPFRASIVVVHMYCVDISTFASHIPSKVLLSMDVMLCFGGTLRNRAITQATACNSTWAMYNLESASFFRSNLSTIHSSLLSVKHNHGWEISIDWRWSGGELNTQALLCWIHKHCCAAGAEKTWSL